MGGAEYKRVHAGYTAIMEIRTRTLLLLFTSWEIHKEYTNRPLFKY